MKASDLLPCYPRTVPVAPSSTARQYTFTSRICSMEEQRVFTSAGDATTMAKVSAREIAPFRRLRLNRNSIPRGEESPLDGHIEKMTTAASCPWNLSTVPTRIGARRRVSRRTWRLYLDYAQRLSRHCPSEAQCHLEPLRILR
jgi:hypothetical protein